LAGLPIPGDQAAFQVPGGLCFSWTVYADCRAGNPDGVFFSSKARGTVTLSERNFGISGSCPEVSDLKYSRI